MQRYPSYRSSRKTHVSLAGWSYCNSGSGVACGPLVSGTSRTTTTVTDFVNRGASPADWQIQIANKRDATSSLEGVRYRIERRDSCEMSYVYNPNRCIRGATYGFLADLVFPKVSYADSTTADMAARSAFLQDYIQKRRLFAGANALAEFRETVMMFRRPVQAMANKTNRLAAKAALIAKRARLNIRGPGSAKIQLARASEELGSAWLGWAWGVSPSLSEISELNAALESYSDGSKSKTTTIVGYGTDERLLNSGQVNPVAYGMVGNYGVYQLQGLEKQTLSVRYKAGVIAVPSGPGGLLTQFGFDPFDIAPAVWEVVPYSHIIDYFMGVGEQLDAMRLAMAAPTYGFRTVRNVTTRTSGSHFVKATPGYTVVASGGHTETSATFVSRSRLSEMPLPIFRFQLPSFGQWVNIGALATQGARANVEWKQLKRAVSEAIHGPRIHPD